MIKDIQAHKMFLDARFNLVLDERFFGSLAMKLELTEDLSPTVSAWTDGKSIGYNPSYIKAQSHASLVWLFAHEACHCVLHHHLRRGPRRRDIWNISCDMAVNWLLNQAGINGRPQGVVEPEERFKDMAVEDIFSILIKELTPQPSSNPQMGQGNGAGGIEIDEETGGIKIDEEEEWDDDLDDNDSDESEDEESKGKGKSKPDKKEEDKDEENEDDLSGDDDDQNDQQDQTPKYQPGEVRDFPGDTEEEAENKAQWLTISNDALMVGRAAGDLPGDIEIQIKDLVSPKISWVEELREYVHQLARTRMDWHRPNKRFVHQDLYLPSPKSEELGTLALVVDASGSMSSNYEIACSEVSGILQDIPFETLYLFYVDTGLCKEVEELTPTDLPIDFGFCGGGGTDFRPAFWWLEEEEIEPDVLIYLTDLECSSYPREPDYPVIWGFIPSYSWRDEDRPVPFGRVVVVDINEEGR